MSDTNQSTRERYAYLIIGANGAVGSSVSRRLRSERNDVLLAGRNQAELSRLGSDLDAPVEELDATRVDQIETAAAKALDLFGRLDGIVNCAGSVLLKPAHLTSADEWQQTLDVNLTSAFAAVRAAAKSVKPNGGTVVLMTSSAARVGLPNHEAIAAAKAGVIGLMQSAAATYASRNLRFNAVAPGLVKSKMTERIWNNERSAEVSQRMHPLGRLGEPEDIARMVTWLLAPANDWITGQVFGIDGGLATLRSTQRA